MAKTTKSAGVNKFPAKDGTLKSSYSIEMYCAIILAVEVQIESQLLITDHDEAIRLLAADIARLPKDRRNDHSHVVLSRRINNFELLPGLKKRDFFKKGRSAVDFKELPKGVLEALPALRTRKPSTTNTPGEQATATPSPATIEVQKSPAYSAITVDIAQPVPRTAAHKSLQAIAQATVLGDASDHLEVLNSMIGIHKQIMDTAEDFVAASGVNGDEAVVDLLLPRSQEWQEIMETLTGSPKPDHEPGLLNIEAMIYQQRLPVETFTRAVIGAAVCRWALEPLPQGDPLVGSRNRFLEREVMRLGADECRILVDSARRQELRQEVEPRIRDRALEMASEIERLVMVYLTPRSRHVRTKHRTVTHLINDNAISSRFSVPQWVMEWRTELRNIFESALKLRVKLENSQEQFTFEFPRPGACYGRSQRAEKGPTGGKATVMIGLMPSLKVRRLNVSTRRTEGAEQIVSDAEVYCFDPNNELDKQDTGASSTSPASSRADSLYTVQEDDVLMDISD